MHDGLRKLIQAKRAWAEPMDEATRAKGFRGWYASEHLPHFDSPGRTQFITYRLADSVPASLRREWQMDSRKTNSRPIQRRIEAYLDAGHGNCYLSNSAVAQLVQENLWHHDGTKYKLWAWVIMPPPE